MADFKRETSRSEKRDCVWKYLPKDNRSLALATEEFLETTGGRDKLFRVFQYYAKFILPFIKGKEQMAQVATFIESLGSVCALTRKMLRIGRYVGCLRNTINRLKEMKGLEASPIIKSISDLANSLYFITDHILLLNRIGAYKFSAKFINQIDVLSNLLWGIECVTNLIYDIIDYYQNIAELQAINQSLKKIENAESEEYKLIMTKKAKLKMDQFKKIVDISRCIADFPMIIHFLTGDSIVPGYVAGFFGVVSSLIGAWQKWIR